LSTNYRKISLIENDKKIEGKWQPKTFFYLNNPKYNTKKIGKSKKNVDICN
jgi:hypothetical protein